MSNLDLDLRQDAINAFCDAGNGFAEAIEYWPTGAVVGREINAIVTRRTPAPIAEDRKNIAAHNTIEVANDATYGILATELNKGSDRVKVAKRVGGSLEFRVVTKIISEDAGMLVLEIQ